MQFISVIDFILLPVYLLIIRAIGIFILNRYYPRGHEWREYFIPGLMTKVLGAIFIGLVYQYYYGYGDTVMYYHEATVINGSFWESPVKWVNLLFRIPKWYSSGYTEYISQLPWYDSPSNFIVSMAASVVGIFTFNKYLCTSVVMSAIAYTGQWAMFRTFARQYPHLTRYIAICCLFIPSVAVWGSGIFKDTLCMFGLGWITYGVFQILINRNFRLTNFVLLGLSVYLVGITKIYILVAFLPSIMLWVFLRYSYKIRSWFLRLLLLPIILAVIGGGFYYISDTNPELLGVYSADQFFERSTITRDYIYSSGTEESSSYSLGEIDPTVQGMLKKLPAAVNVTLFRPYVWEARKPIVFFNALESSLFLFLMLRLLFQVGLIGIWQAIIKDPTVQFFLVFTIIFAFAIGISTYNFGSLSRYRIPCLPFFAMALGLIYYTKFSPQQRKFLPFGERAQ
jgi:hypothetical protein